MQVPVLLIPSPVKLKQNDTVKQGLKLRPSLQNVPLALSGMGFGEEEISQYTSMIFLVLKITATSDLYAPTAKSTKMKYKFDKKTKNKNKTNFTICKLARCCFIM
jgi:hypothetical protein